jgi:hypothetical protein
MPVIIFETSPRPLSKENPMISENHRQPRWASRKFILTVSAQLTALIVLFWPGQESEIVEASTSITSLLVVLATSLGYVVSEAKIDAQNTPPARDPDTSS